MKIVASKRLLALWSLTLLSCSGNQPPESTVQESMWEIPNLQERGMLLLVEDRRQFDPFAVETTRQADPELRVELAETLGRVGDSRGFSTLEELLGDSEARVRRSAAFGLGLLGDQRGESPLLRAVTDPDQATGTEAVASLAALETDLQKVIAVLQTLPPEETWPRLLPSLYRFAGESALAIARQGLELDQAVLRRMAAYALARDPVRATVPQLRQILQDADPWIRGWGARGLGQVGGSQDIGRLKPLLNDTTTPTVQALRAAKSLIQRGEVAPPEDWIPELLRLMDHSDPGVSTTAIEAASAWLLDETLAEALVGLVKSGSRRQQEVAFLALAEGGDSRGVALLQPLARDADPRWRALAATAASELEMHSTVVALLQDPAKEVRLAAVTGIAKLEAGAAGSSIASALSDEDPAVRGRALEWAAEYPEISVEQLEKALAGPPRQPVELYLNGTAALLARALNEPLERGEIVRILEELASRADYPIRVQAGIALEELGRPRPAPGPASVRRTAATYREMIRRSARPRFVEISTLRGVAKLELDCPLAPLTCLNFLQLVNQGFYDGLELHRVVPDFVVQGGDPRGDGWGGPGYTIRDEINASSFGEGVIGMALAGPDTGGSQFFITLSPQPHLDASFTAFGRVIEGFDVLLQLEQGARIERMREVPGRR